MTNDPWSADGLAFFLYRSSAADGLADGDLQEILKTARSRNQAQRLTGCLHHEDGLFFQWLEGPAVAMGPVVASILGDDRHRDIMVLDQGALDHRRFQDWRMRFSDRDHASLLDWFAGSNTSTVDRQDYAGGIVAFLQSISV